MSKNTLAILIVFISNTSYAGTDAECSQSKLIETAAKNVCEITRTKDNCDKAKEAKEKRKAICKG